MENIINLGGKDYSYKVNFKLSYGFLPYRGRIQTGFDITKANKKVLKEIMEMQAKVEAKQKEIAEGKTKVDDLSEFDFLDDLSLEAKQFLQENDNSSTIAKFTLEEIEDMVRKFTGIVEEEKIEEILDYEVENYGYDAFVTKLLNAVAQVFTNAKVKSV